jgi:osmotically inducible lipoprotein OsmB
MHKHRFTIILLIGSAFGLAACGETREQRVITGAAGGALAGEVVADEPLGGAALGGLVGAVR